MDLRSLAPRFLAAAGRIGAEARTSAAVEAPVTRRQALLQALAGTSLALGATACKQSPEELEVSKLWRKHLEACELRSASLSELPILHTMQEREFPLLDGEGNILPMAVLDENLRKHMRIALGLVEIIAQETKASPRISGLREALKNFLAAKPDDREAFQKLYAVMKGVGAFNQCLIMTGQDLALLAANMGAKTLSEEELMNVTKISGLKFANSGFSSEHQQLKTLCRTVLELGMVLNQCKQDPSEPAENRLLKRLGFKPGLVFGAEGFNQASLEKLASLASRMMQRQGIEEDESVSPAQDAAARIIDTAEPPPQVKP